MQPYDKDGDMTLATLQAGGKGGKKGKKDKDGDEKGKKKSHKAKKRAAGVARPWTPIEVGLTICT